MTQDQEGRGNRRRRKVPQKVTPDGLERAALSYLERYASSTANLRHVLMTRVKRSAFFHGTDPERGAAWVDAIIARYAAAGILDDGAYAELHAERLFAQGYGRQRIALKLRQKGVGSDAIGMALDNLAEQVLEPDLLAALRYAKRRRLGPYRSRDRPERRDKDLAALARAGFDIDTARRVIDTENADELFAEAEGTE